MEATKAETTNNAAQSEEVSKFYRALAVAQANIILYVSDTAGDMEELKKRATEITEKLETTFAFDQQGSQDQKCGNGLVWNPITQQCE